MRKFIFAGLLVLIAGFTMGPQINTSGRCSLGQDCSVGGGIASGITLDTDGADLNIDGTTGNALTVTATTTASPTFIGADAATPADTIFDTTGAGTVQIGSADVTGVTMVTDGSSLNLEGTAANTLTLTAATTGTMTIMGQDAADPSNLTIDTGTSGAITIGSADVGSVTVLAAGGGFVAPAAVISMTAGTLTMNTVHLATAAGDYSIPAAGCTAAADIGNWFTVVLEDASVVVVIAPLDDDDVITVPGLGLGAGDELDSVSDAAHEGVSMTLTCLALDNWYMTGGTLTNATFDALAWADGGAT